VTAYSTEIVIHTKGRAIIDVTDEIARVARSCGITDGLLNVFIRHTSASLIVSENADPDVLTDLERFMSDLVKDGDRRFVHTAEGPDDMPSHVRSVLTMTSVSVPLRGGRLHLGTWQAIYLWEHRRHGHTRTLEITVVG
jgi:secondary thiamine-phosphate synthase enzyme